MSHAFEGSAAHEHDSGLAAAQLKIGMSVMARQIIDVPYWPVDSARRGAPYAGPLAGRPDEVVTYPASKVAGHAGTIVGLPTEANPSVYLRQPDSSTTRIIPAPGSERASFEIAAPHRPGSYPNMQLAGEFASRYEVHLTEGASPDEPLATVIELPDRAQPSESAA